MGNYTTQISFGGLQYERLMKWMHREKFEGKVDAFVRSKFKEMLDINEPDVPKEPKVTKQG
jgi:hypothetical protein